jgi:hypothetical protein
VINFFQCQVSKFQKVWPLDPFECHGHWGCSLFFQAQKAKTTTVISLSFEQNGKDDDDDDDEVNR